MRTAKPNIPATTQRPDVEADDGDCFVSVVVMFKGIFQLFTGSHVGWVSRKA